MLLTGAARASDGHRWRLVFLSAVLWWEMAASAGQLEPREQCGASGSWFVEMECAVVIRVGR